MNTSEDGWTTDEPRATDPATLERVRLVLENESPLIVEHRYYYGASAPHRFICESFTDFTTYLANEVRPGDSIWMWTYSTVCTDEAALLHGKKPNSNGATPLGGAY